MRLKELFANNPIHFIDDIPLFEDNMFVGSQPFDKFQNVSFDVAYSRPVGTFNGLEIWGSKYFGGPYDLYGILDKQRNILAWVIFDIERHPGFSTFIRAWVEPSERGKDHTLTILNFIVSKGKEKIFIDKNEQTSTDSRRLIKKWLQYPPQKRHFDIKFFDSNGMIDNPNVEDILKPRTINDVYLILENTFNRDVPRYGAGRRVISEFVWY